MRVNLPAASPFIYTGVKIAVSVALILAIGAEIVAGGSSGLGIEMGEARALGNVKLSYAYVTITGVIGLVLVHPDGGTRTRAVPVESADRGDDQSIDTVMDTAVSEPMRPCLVATGREQRPDRRRRPPARRARRCVRGVAPGHPIRRLDLLPGPDRGAAGRVERLADRRDDLAGQHRAERHAPAATASSSPRSCRSRSGWRSVVPKC